MTNILFTFVYAFIMASSTVIVWHKLLNIKLSFKSKYLYICFFCVLIISSLSYLLLNRFRIIIITIIFMFYIKLIFKRTIQESILVPIYYEFMLLLSEFITVILLSLILGNNIQEFITNNWGILIVNLLVSIISVLLVQLKIVRATFNKILAITDKIKFKQLIILCLLITIFLNIYVMSAYHKVKFEYWVFTNFILVSIFFIIILYYFKTKNKLNKVSDKYSVAIKSLNDYESMMARYRISNHENKNLLLTIRAMVLNKDKNIPQFIDNIIENKYDDDEKLLFDMNIIPSGGLRATIYSEILKIKEKGINYSFHIDRKFKTIDLIEIDTNTIIDICKIVGVFIDNAIEEVEKLKRKTIGIDLYTSGDNLNIKICNNYGKSFNISKINTDGYTTKGSNHGYGLSLVKEIIKNNNLLDHEMELNKKYFSQIIIIKYKKR